MSHLDQFLQILCGRFDNRTQWEQMQELGEKEYPLARHVNTRCNDKILNLPADFAGVFVLEESYYTIGERTNASPHLFLFTEEGEDVKLTSYDLPKEAVKAGVTYETMEPIPFDQLQLSQKFTPAIYHWKDGVWEGGSVSMFTATLKFTLFERFSPEVLEVSETMEVNGKRTFGYDVPIRYRPVREQEN